MSDIERYSVNHPHIIHEIIQGEAILVNLQTGSYFSTDAVGAVIWDLVQAGLPVSQIVTTIAASYDAPTAAIQTAITTLITELQQEGLIYPDANPLAAAAPIESALPATADAAKQPFVPPILRKYTEIEDLLLLDPIHDVDDSGWPNRLPETK